MANLALENNELDHVPKFGPDPFWAFVWPGSYALHRFINADPHVVKDKNVLDFASGCGLAAITAKLNNAHAVSANDIDLYSAASIEMNASLNNVDISTTTGNLIGEDVKQDVILAGDIFYEEALGADVMKWLESQRENNNSRVFIGDPGRAALPIDHPKLKLRASYPLSAWLRKQNHGYLEAKVYEIL
ncbi:hypothetical protein TrLO_g3146 [Triparma laevis f. longispina]|uniref:ETFB lysine methyltransferase n=1 Tax=Triparma laevis f. longispina TaxID=1714387 RepID=A0A9W7F336_9STRA|nr:hypothetical protein TrLO_g3146 [Triparma laevis f. longispina]